MLDFRRVIQIHSDIINAVAVPPTGMLQKVDLISRLFLWFSNIHPNLICFLFSVVAV